MDVSFQRVNPNDGNSAVVLHFELNHGANPALLIDPGSGVDISQHLGTNDYLAGVCLTHLHRDHYSSLPENVENGVPIFTSAVNQTLVQEVIHKIDYKRHDSPVFTEWGSKGLFDHVIAPEGWHYVTDDIHIRLIPAGHTIGNVGFVVRFFDGDEPHHIFIPGEIGFDQVAGTPGIPDEFPVEPEVVIVSGNRQSPYESSLDEIVSGVLEEAGDGCVQVAASSLTCMQIGLLLERIQRTEQLDVDIHLCGTTGAMFEELEFEAPGIESHVKVSDLESITKPNAILLSGPDDCSGGHAKRIRRSISGKGGSTVRVGTEYTAKDSVSDRLFVRTVHPPVEDVVSFVGNLSPIHTIVMGNSDEGFSDEIHDSFVWINKGHQGRQRLFEKGEWQGVPWLDSRVNNHIMEKANRTLGSVVGGDVEWPTTLQNWRIDVEAEGLDLDNLTIPESLVSKEPDDSDEERAQDINLEQPARFQGRYSTSANGFEGLETTAKAIQIEGDMFLLKPDELPDEVEDGAEMDVVVYPDAA